MEEKPDELAGLAALAAAQGELRRYQVAQIPLVGTVRLRSVRADEYAAIETLQTRAAVALRNKKPELYAQLNAEAFFQLALLMWVDAEGNPVLKNDEHCRELLRNLDNVANQALQEACLKWAGLGDHDQLESAAKK